MSRVLCILICFLFCLCARGDFIDKRIILKIRHSIEKNIEYINRQHKRVNEDCLFGVVISTALMADAYYNGSNVMDSSTRSIVAKLVDVLEKSLPYIKADRLWIEESILLPTLWQKDVKYKYNYLSIFGKITNYDVLEKIRKYQNDEIFIKNMDYCLQDLTNITRALRPQKCFLEDKCQKIYRIDDKSSGYILTHKLLLLQLARSRKCIVASDTYDRRIRELCFQIYSEVFNGDYFDVLDEMFDLFLEEVILCGYEGYTEFLSNKWLLYILKSQRPSGCFPANLKDSLKTKIKRTTNIFEDGCADHTTGIGLAVLSLYYNFIVKELFV